MQEQLRAYDSFIMTVITIADNTEIECLIVDDGNCGNSSEFARRRQYANIDTLHIGRAFVVVAAAVISRSLMIDWCFCCPQMNVTGVSHVMVCTVPYVGRNKALMCAHLTFKNSN